MRHHLRFRRLHPGIVIETRDLERMDPWRLSKNRQLKLTCKWIDSAAELYALTPPQVEFHPAVTPFGGMYDAGANVIVLPYFSLMTLLHEFRHAMQAGGYRMVGDGPEDDARAWSASVFYQACPDRFKRMVLAGRIMYITPEDLKQGAQTREQACLRALKPTETSRGAPGREIYLPGGLERPGARRCPHRDAG